MPLSDLNRLAVVLAVARGAGLTHTEVARALREAGYRQSSASVAELCRRGEQIAREDDIDLAALSLSQYRPTGPVAAQGAPSSGPPVLTTRP